MPTKTEWGGESVTVEEEEVEVRKKWRVKIMVGRPFFLLVVPVAKTLGLCLAPICSACI